jgi:6-phosphogluconolactonase (cycloisomerase 2 family)
VRRTLAAGAVAVLASAGIAMAAGGGVPTVKFKSVPVPKATLGLPYTAVVSPNGKTLYVTDLFTGVLAINLAHPSAAPTQITIGGNPFEDPIGLALSPNGRTLYVSGYGAGTSSGVYVADVSGSSSDPDNDTFVSQIKDPSAVLNFAAALAVSRNGKLLYIGNDDEATGHVGDDPEIAVANLTNVRTGTIVQNEYVKGAGVTTELNWSPNGKLLYAANFVGDAVVLKISGEVVTVDKHLPQANQIYSLAVSPDGRTLYGDLVSSSATGEAGDGVPGSSEFQTFALRKNGVSPSLRRNQLIALQHADTGLAISPNGKTLYAVAFYQKVPGEEDSDVGSLFRFAIPAAATKVKISGHNGVGSKLTAKVKHATGASLSFQWYANGKKIKHADKSSLTVIHALAGKRISVKVTAGAAGYHPATVTAKT